MPLPRVQLSCRLPGRELLQTALKADSEELDVQSLQANVYEQATPMQAGKPKRDWVILDWVPEKLQEPLCLQCCSAACDTSFFEGAAVCSLLISCVVTFLGQSCVR